LNIDVDTRTKKHDLSELDEDTDFPEEITFEGKKYDLKVPKCCNPRQSDVFRAFKTKDGKIVAHRANCPNVYTCDLTKEVQIQYHAQEMHSYPLRVDVKDKVGILGEILNFVVGEKETVDAVNTRLGRDGRLIITLDIRKRPGLDIKDLMDKFKQNESVLNVLIEDERHTNRYLPRSE
jgi:(p)ppGpp synthase/HD superfamily hydrolase